MATLPVYAVEVGWRSYLTGTVTGFPVVGTATVGGADTVPGPFWDTSWEAITADVKTADWQRGAADEDATRVQGGTARLTLVDTEGTYNPLNTTSPLNGLLVPMRPVRITATHPDVNGGAAVTLFRGFIRRIEHDPHPNAKESRIDCVDFFEWLRASRPTIASTGVTTVGTVIGLILDAVGFTDGALRALDTGHPLSDFSAAGTTSALDLVQNLLTVDRGLVFVSGGGVVTYYDTNRLYGTAGTVEATFADALIGGLTPAVDVGTIVNGQTVTRTGGAAQTYTDANSRQAYGYRDGSPITSTYLVDDSQALSLATFRVLANKDPRPPARSIGITNRTDTSIAHLLEREMGERVTVSEALGGSALTGTILGLKARLWGGGSSAYRVRHHHASYTVAPLGASGAFGSGFAIVGSSSVGGADVVGY